MKALTFVGGVAALALLAGCGQQQTQTPAPEPAPAPAEPAPAPEAAVPTPAPAPDAAPPAAATPAAATENYADFTGNAQAGKAVFIQCQACHSIKQGENRVGPSLYNKIGATAGQVPGFKYSEANKNSGIVWTEEKLFEYLKNPRAVIPGTTMAFAGIPDPQKRADLIAFLKANGNV
ncbi:MAG: c-type cytochrome [Sphingomonadaceae bacterium]